MKLAYLIYATSFLLFSCTHKTDIFNILDYGAVNDSTITSTKAINDAIQKCNENGGGRVTVPAGIFVSGTIVLLSNVDLHLDPGAVIRGSKDTSDYLPLKDTLFLEGYNRYGLIYAGDAKNISISGIGEINGNGTYFMNGIDKPHVGRDFDRKFTRQGQEFMKEGTVFEDGPLSYNYRPGIMITIEHSENIHITGLTLRDAPEWTLRIGDCDGAVVSGITIDNNQLIPNNDGIHCTTSRNIRISDCNIQTGDDAIIVSGFGKRSKSSNPAQPGNKTGIAENVAVTNCVLSSRSACIRVGYGENPIRNLVFDNLVMHASNRGIGVFSRNNSDIRNVLFSNIIIDTRIHSGHWWGKGEPIHISAIRSESGGNAGKIDNIRFSNIIATAETGIVIFGVKESPIANVFFDNVKLSINNGRFSEQYGGNFDLRPAYPIDSALFRHDIPGLYAQYVKNFSVCGFELDWGPSLPTFFTNGVEIDHYDGIDLQNLSVGPALKDRGLAPIKLSNGIGSRVNNQSR